MKRSFAGLVIVAVIVVAILYFAGGMIISKGAVAGVQSFVPKITQTDVSMGGLKVSPLTGSGEVHDFVLGNPEGYKSSHSIAFTRAHLDLVPMSVLGSHIRIEKIHIYQPRFNYERKLLSSNIKEILNNIQAASGRPVEEAEDLPPEVEESGIRIEIKEFIIEEAEVSMTVAGTTVPVKVPRIVLRDIGTADEGIPPDEIAFEVMSVVLRQVVEAAGKAPGKAAGGAIDGIKDIFGGGD